MKEVGFKTHGTGRFAILENGDVIKHESFPCSTPGKDFLRQVVRSKKIGNIGEQGVHLLQETDFYYLFLFSTNPPYMMKVSPKINKLALLPETPAALKASFKAQPAL